MFSKPIKVDIHPLSLKHIFKGHPWITLDSFSKKFPNSNFFLRVVDKHAQEIALLLHDPQHPKVKARLWSLTPPFKDIEKDFFNLLRERLKLAIAKRKNLEEKRNNYYVCFGETDDLPGLFIEKLGPKIIVRCYALYWGQFTRELFREIKKVISEGSLNGKIENYYLQMRSNDRNATFVDLKTSKKVSELKWQINEFDINYQIKLGTHYDYGIYTDMSAIRELLKPLFSSSKNVLNLYSYTGSFSLYALKQGAEKVTSVDLSQKYLDWLDENFELNPDLERSKHTSICSSVDNALKNTKNSSYDLIISDPPSSSSDGNKVSASFSSYKDLLPKLEKICSPGGHLLLFLNTHQITRKKFVVLIEKIITENKLPLKIEQKFKMSSDCLPLPGFPEGDYLKGLLLKKS